MIRRVWVSLALWAVILLAWVRLELVEPKPRSGLLTLAIAIVMILTVAAASMMARANGEDNG